MQTGILFLPIARRATLRALLPFALASVLVAALPLGSDVAAAGPFRIPVEAESYAWGRDAGGDPISMSACDTSASGALAVYGVDYPGDWIHLEVIVPQDMMLQDSLRSAGDTGLRRKWVVEWVPLGPGVSPGTDTLATTPPGKGVT